MKKTDWFVHFSDRDAYGRLVYLEPMKWVENGWPVIGIDDDGDGCGEPVEEYAMPKGGKLGATVGLYALADPDCKDRGWIDADWFRVVRK